MRKFQIGDKVKCIDIMDDLNGVPFPNLTLNKVYTVTSIGRQSSRNYIEILNDMDLRTGFYESRFEKIEDITEEIDFLNILKGY